jgi:hypothetical protein
MDPTSVKKRIEDLWIDATLLYPDEDKEQDEGFWGRI